MRNRNQKINDTNIEDTLENEEVIQQDKKTTVCEFLCDFIKLYSYAQTFQKIAIIIGVGIGVSLGVSHPLFLYLWFEQLNFAIINQGDLKPYLGVFRTYLYYFIALGIGFMFFNGILFAIWKFISRSISKKIRIRFLQQFIKQSLSKVEKRNSYEWANDFKIHTLNIQKSIGDKVALLLNLIGIVVSGVASAMIIRWTYSLYMLVLTPIIIAILSYFIYIQVQKKKINIESGKQAQDKALEATSMIKTVKMLNGQQKEVADYQNKLVQGEIKLQQYNMKLGLSTGLFFCMQYLFFGAGFLMGIQCVKGGDSCPVSVTGSRYAINEFLSVFFQIFFCTYNFLQLGSNYTLIKSAIGSSKKIFSFIDQPKVERQHFQNEYPDNIQKIIIKNLYFQYPLHPQQKILSNLNLQFVPFKFNAIVGTTGSGKSTIIQLLLKQYDPSQGQILINSINLSRVRTSYWLDQIGVVTQQPVLFDGTIRQNVKVGKADANDEEIINALTQANIYDFVISKREGLDFEIGVGGSKLSGGQKQRIAIARALIKKPKLLILDQATSALDPSTERQIQSALEDIRRTLQNQITIICIAHRIKTIKDADRIFLIKNGEVAEQGLFEELEYFQKEQFNNIAKPKKHTMLQEQQKYNKIQIKKMEFNYPHNQQPKQNKKQQAPIKAAEQPSIYLQLLKYTTSHKGYILCLVLAVIIGCSHLSASILISYHIDRLNRFFLLGKDTNWCDSYGSICSDQLDQHFKQSQTYLYGLIALAVFTFFPYFLQINLLSKIENQIAYNLKKYLFKKLLSLEVKFFEKKQNQSGGAVSKFGNDSRDSSTLVTAYIPILLCNFCIAIGAVLICMSYEWRFGLLSIIVTPLISLSFYVSMLFIGGYQDSSLQKLNKADQTANQLITTFKTVLVLNYQKRFFEKYKSQVEQPFLETIKVGGKIGLFYGFAFFTLDVVVGMSLYFSVVILSQNPQIKPISIIIYMIVSTFSGFIIGNNFYFIAHISASKESGSRVMEIVNAESEYEIQKKMRRQLAIIEQQDIKGKIQFKNISFKYKDDDSKLVLDNVSFTINPGSKVAFVGQSGCGKSTLLQLLLRFYSFEGEILVDGINIYDYDLKQYRSIYSMLNQQPSLFAGTIEENIKYNTDISEDQLNQVCRKSCAYKLNMEQSVQQSIFQFRQRKVGPKGSNISGGEKQRIACARALARNSQIFLMDEGTSALDRRTEIEVQRGVNQQFNGKTMITVAHRIQTIYDSDEIFVFSHGQLIQFGSPKELLQKRSYYYSFVNGNKSQI